MKKFFIFVLLLLIFTCSCNVQTKKTDNISPDFSDKDISTNLLKDFPTIEETVLMNEEDVIVTAKELVYDEQNGVGLSVCLENHSSTNLYIQCDNLAANHNQADMPSFDHFLCYVNSGQVIYDTIYLDVSEWDTLGMTLLTDIEISFIVTFYHKEDAGYIIADSQFYSDNVELHTSAYENGAQRADFSSGQEIFNQDGFHVIVKCTKSDNPKYEAEVMLFAENNTEQKLRASSYFMRINNIQITEQVDCLIIPGQSDFCRNYISKEILKENGIESFDNIEMSFFVQIEDENYDYDTSEKLAETDFISIPLTP